jgi:hypothetical protein
VSYFSRGTILLGQLMGVACYQMIIHVCNGGDGIKELGGNLKVNVRRGQLGYATVDRRSNYMPISIIYLKGYGKDHD